MFKRIYTFSLIAIASFALASCCCTRSANTTKSATAPGANGSPSIGLIPTMKKLAE